MIASANQSIFPAMLAASVLAAACAVLSVIVVLRRWAFVGEGISHSGFGGAGTAWLLALAFPALDRPWVPYVAVVLFGLGTALAIARLTRSSSRATGSSAGERVGTDAAVGVFLVASLAWGFLAQHVYLARRNAQPYGFLNLLFGQIGDISPQFALSCAAVSAAVLLIVAMLGKEIVAYCFDPLTAQTSGVRSGFVHDLLMILIAVVIVIGARVAGSVLIVAMLVLPGATALQLGGSMRRVLCTSLVAALIGSTTGVIVGMRWHIVPVGPAIVLSLFVLFLASVLAGRTVSVRKHPE
jgi:ABC-type Mn2+/Zn2+ transport system permease subunit